MCKSFLLEAKWYRSGYMPILEEYMDNAWISVSGPVILLHTYTLIANPATKEALQFLEEYRNVIRWPSVNFRLANDLATSSVRTIPVEARAYMQQHN
ncbi:hypothetical protein KPL71_024310 [Citrus sinensis]|uniref:Uncharacterized protein n=1 Tax=Citrus sinensis TaxID=2711 RepID=A0ACB8IR21_CITSI|nr:hypothetical protein KPL71_024310 [Citrus sinensis]